MTTRAELLRLEGRALSLVLRGILRGRVGVVERCIHIDAHVVHGIDIGFGVEGIARIDARIEDVTLTIRALVRRDVVVDSNRAGGHHDRQASNERDELRHGGYSSREREYRRK